MDAWIASSWVKEGTGKDAVPSLFAIVFTRIEFKKKGHAGSQQPCAFFSWMNRHSRRVAFQRAT